MDSQPKLVKYLNAPVDNAPLIIFRILFGFLLILECWGAIATGWVYEAFVEPDFTFTFIGFEWMRIFNGPLMYAWYVVMGIAAAGIMSGKWYRFSAAVFAILWHGSYLMQKCHYNNHYYLIALLAWVMLFLPAHSALSLDVKNKIISSTNWCRRWHLWLLLALFSMVYFYGGLAKLNPDWMSGTTMEMLFARKKSYWLIGPLLSKPSTAFIFAWGGILFDLLIVPVLLWRPSRIVGVGLALFFHLFNAIIFQVGIFPFMMLVALIFYFPPQQIRKLFWKTDPIPSKNTALHDHKNNRILLPIVLVFFLIQLSLPLRHHLISGDVNWTEEGHRMSWRMMLRIKNGSLKFKIIDKQSGDISWHNPREQLTINQAQTIVSKPDLIWQYVQWLKKYYQNTKGMSIEIYAISSVSLNGHEAHPLVDPRVDLAAVSWRHLAHSRWVYLRKSNKK